MVRNAVPSRCWLYALWDIYAEPNRPQNKTGQFSPRPPSEPFVFVQFNSTSVDVTFSQALWRTPPEYQFADKFPDWDWGVRNGKPKIFGSKVATCF